MHRTFLLPYKMKYWQEYYLANYKRKHFGGINIGNLDKIISYICLTWQLGSNLMCACCPSAIVDMESEVPL